MTQIKRYHIIENTIAGSCTVAETATLLHLSTRRIKQLKIDATNLVIDRTF